MKIWMPYVAALLLIFLACEPKTEPGISDEQWTRLLFDLQVAKVAVQRHTEPNRDSVSTTYRRQILDKHGLTDEDFAQLSMALQNDPERLKRLYAEVEATIDSLRQMETKSPK